MAHIQTFETPREPRIVRRNDTVHDATTKRYIYMLIPVKTSLNIRKQINAKKCPDIFISLVIKWLIQAQPLQRFSSH